MSEKAPLHNYRLNTSTDPESKDEAANSRPKHGGDRGGRRFASKSDRKLGVVFGVVIPTLLSMFSVVVFLRIGKLKKKNKKALLVKTI